MTTKTKPDAEKLGEEEREMDAEISRLEAERTELESPVRVLTWEEIQAGAAEDLERREGRRGILPRLITAAKVRRLQIRRDRHEREAEPLRKLREDAHARLEAATAKRLEATEEENAARFDYSDANFRVESREERAREIEREIRALRGEA